jgi:hypothetical protein
VLCLLLLLLGCSARFTWAAPKLVVPHSLWFVESQFVPVQPPPTITNYRIPPPIRPSLRTSTASSSLLLHCTALHCTRTSKLPRYRSESLQYFLRHSLIVESQSQSSAPVQFSRNRTEKGRASFIARSLARRASFPPPTTPSSIDLPSKPLSRTRLLPRRSDRAECCR